MKTFLELLNNKISEFPSKSGSYLVAFSGGLDSTVLLAGMQRLRSQFSFRAVHIDHGFHPDSSKWEVHCREGAGKLGVDYVSSRIHIRDESGHSLEALAREGRYRALKDLLFSGEVLLTAHHANDQLETLLLRLLRGSGVRGMRGISEFYRFGKGYLGRPLLNMSQDEIRRVGVNWGLHWLEDPMNSQQRFDRNFLRSSVIPHIVGRWPSAGKIAERMARQMDDAHTILKEVAESDSLTIVDPARVPLEALLGLPMPRQKNVLRHLVERVGLPVPDSVQMNEILKSVRVSRIDAETQVQWPGGEGRIYRGVLYLFSPLGAGSGEDYTGELTQFEPWAGPEGRVALVPTSGPGLSDDYIKNGLSVRFRVGGECFKPMRYKHSRPLKKWFQESGVPPWLRGRIPLLYRDAELVAVGDLWIADIATEEQKNKPRWQVSWTNHPPLS